MKTGFKYSWECDFNVTLIILSNWMCLRSESEERQVTGLYNCHIIEGSNKTVHWCSTGDFNPLTADQRRNNTAMSKANKQVMVGNIIQPPSTVTQWAAEINSDNVSTSGKVPTSETHMETECNSTYTTLFITQLKMRDMHHIKFQYCNNSLTHNTPCGNLTWSSSATALYLHNISYSDYKPLQGQVVQYVHLHSVPLLFSCLPHSDLPAAVTTGFPRCVDH